jgi:hypothetical protein
MLVSPQVLVVLKLNKIEAHKLAVEWLTLRKEEHQLPLGNHIIKDDL